MLTRIALPLLFLTALAGNVYAAVDPPPQPDGDAAAWLRALYEAIVSGEWKIAAGFAMIGVVFALRTWGSKAIPWLATKTGGMVLAFVVALGFTIGTALAAGAPIKLATIMTALGTAAAAAGVWEWVKSWLPSVNASNEKTKASADDKAGVS